MEKEVHELDLGVYDVSRNACGTLEFDRADEIIALGYKKAKECLS